MLPVGRHRVAILGPLPQVACSVIKTESIGRKTSDGSASIIVAFIPAVLTDRLVGTCLVPPPVAGD